MEERIRQVLASVFNVDISKIDENSSPDNIDNWDSLHHMKLVLALEEEFDVQLEDEQISNLLNYKLILITLKELT